MIKDAIEIGAGKLTRELITELMPIIRENHSETGHFKELAINWEMYLSLGTSFVPYVMRNRRTYEIVGYLFFMIGAYPHNFKWMMAQQVSFFVKKEYRRHSLTMMQYSEEDLKRCGVRIVVQSARIDSGFCKVLERRGYEPADITYTKRL